MENYKIGESIGKGNYGEVFLAQCISEGKNYVIKKLKIQNMKPKERESIENEIKILKQVRHPNVVSYKESFVDAEQCINIVMMYCQDGDLYKKIRAANNEMAHFEEEQVWEWLAQLVLALNFLHSQKILHRDLKTQNIFLHGDRLFLGDFGISKSLDNTRELAETYIGTPYYMSPELFNYKPYSYKSDLWSLGCVLYEMCNLKHAFNAQTINGLAIKILKGNYSPVSTRYSKELRDIVHSLLDTNPRSRPSIVRLAGLPSVRKHLIAYLLRLARSGCLVDDLAESCRGQVAAMGLGPAIEAELRAHPSAQVLLVGKRVAMREEPKAKPVAKAEVRKQPSEKNFEPRRRQQESARDEFDEVEQFEDEEDEFDFLEDADELRVQSHPPSAPLTATPKPEMSHREFEDSFNNSQELESLDSKSVAQEELRVPEDLKLLPRLAEKVATIRNRINYGLGEPLACQAVELVRAHRDAPEALQSAFLSLVGEKNLGYWHLIDQVLYFEEEMEQLRFANIR